jgi:tctex1 domain-containing protein 2
MDYKYLNQHLMKPRPGTKFLKGDVEKMIEKVCQEKVGNRSYIFDEVQPLIKDLCAEIQQRVLALGYDRYKLVSQITVMEAANQGIRIASRCLWDSEVDNYAEFTYSTPNMHVNVLVFGLYWE